MEKYAVISFREGGISVVPKCWIINTNTAYWPKNTKNLRTLIIRANEPNPEWPTYDIIYLYGVYDNYEEALEMEKQAVKESESEAENRGPGKRKFKTKRMFTPPPSFSGTSTESEKSSNSSRTMAEALSEDIIILPRNLEDDLFNDDTLNPNEPSTLKTVEVEIHNPAEKTDDMIVGGNLGDNISVTKQITNEELFQKMEEISVTLKFILARLNLLEAPNSGQRPAELDFSGLPQFPLQTLAEILDLEELLKNETFQKKLLNKLLQVSGGNEVEFIRRGLGSIFSNKVATACSWTGQKNNFRVKDCTGMVVLKDPLQSLKNVEIIVGDFNLIGPHIYNLPKVKWIHGTWAGLDSLLPHIKKEAPPTFPITRTSGDNFGQLMSEYVIGNIVFWERNYFKVKENQIAKLWDERVCPQNHRSIADIKVGILGIGAIGNRIGKNLNNLGATIYGLGRRNNIPLENEEYRHISKYFHEGNLVQLLSSVDYVINILPNTNETTNILGNGVLRNCKDRKVVFVNIGRGNVIKESELVEALQEKWIAGAILDVFRTEPLPTDCPLWSMPNVFITPHIAGISREQDIAAKFKMNFERMENNQPLLNQIDFARGY